MCTHSISSEQVTNGPQNNIADFEICQHQDCIVGKTSHTATGEWVSHDHKWWTSACSESKQTCGSVYGEIKIWGSHTASVTEVSLLGCGTVALSKHFLLFQRITVSSSLGWSILLGLLNPSRKHSNLLKRQKPSPNNTASHPRRLASSERFTSQQCKHHYAYNQA
jgi:hypothetical protein